MPGEGVDVALRAGTMILPGRPAIVRAHEPTDSIPTSRRSPSCGLGAIQRTCDVHGRGGKLHDGRDGSSSSASSGRHVSPPLSLRKRRLGSVPAYRRPLAELIAREKTADSGSAQSTQFRPASCVRRTPPSRKPA